MSRLYRINRLCRPGRIIAVLLCCILLSACAAPAAMQTLSQADERMLSDIRTQYRGATAIVEGVGSGRHVDSGGDECYDIHVSDVYAGGTGGRDIVHCGNNPVEEGGRYLLFLGEGEDVHYAEDVAGYTLGAALRIEDEELLWDGRRLPLTTVKEEIRELGEVIVAPAPVLYYDTLAALAEAADEIFIGRVTKLPPYSKLTFSVRDGGAVEKAQYDATVATIEVFGSIKGAFSRYGQHIQLVYSPERAGSMIDAATLQPAGYSPENAPALTAHGVYLFFLKSGPDSKQPYYFPINPVQGFVNVTNDDLNVCAANKPLLSMRTLTQVVGELHSVLKWKQPGNDDAPLLIIEE